MAVARAILRAFGVRRSNRNATTVGAPGALGGGAGADGVAAGAGAGGAAPPAPPAAGGLCAPAPARERAAPAGRPPPDHPARPARARSAQRAHATTLPGARQCGASWGRLLPARAGGGRLGRRRLLGGRILFAGTRVEAQELLAGPLRLLGPSRALVGAGQRELHVGALRRERGALLELLHRANGL